jgi:hypothetical protein
MKTIILVAAVAAFEFAFLASIATTPGPQAGEVSSVRSAGEGAGRMAQRSGAPVPCTPPG